MDDHLMGAKAEAELKSVGWDGASNPIVELRSDCGCKWTGDGRSLPGACVSAMNEMRYG